MANDMRDRLVYLLKKADVNANLKFITDYEDAILDNAEYLIANGVVPVVRCKDCKHYERPDLEEDNYFCTAEHTNKLFSPNKTDYCSYGERKADNDL